MVTCTKKDIITKPITPRRFALLSRAHCGIFYDFTAKSLFSPRRDEDRENIQGEVQESKEHLRDYFVSLRG